LGGQLRKVNISRGKKGGLRKLISFGGGKSFNGDSAIRSKEGFSTRDSPRDIKKAGEGYILRGSQTYFLDRGVFILEETLSERTL